MPATASAAPWSDDDLINFGDLPDSTNALLQQGATYRTNKAAAEQIFRQALESAPRQLPIYFCLYKIYTYQGNLDHALAAAEAGLAEAARQVGWSADWRNWTPQSTEAGTPARFALYTLKALAFIHLRRNEPDQARKLLDGLSKLDPTGAVGWPVIAALAEGID